MGVDSSSSDASATKGASCLADLLDDNLTSAVVPHGGELTGGELTASPESAVVASNPSKYPPQYVPRSDTAVGVRKPLATPAGSAASPTVAAAFRSPSPGW